MADDIKTAVELDGRLTQALAQNSSTPNNWPQSLSIKPINKGQTLFTAPGADGKPETYALWMGKDNKFVAIPEHDVQKILDAEIKTQLAQPNVSAEERQRLQNLGAGANTIGYEPNHPAKQNNITVEPSFTLTAEALKNSKMMGVYAAPQVLAQAAPARQNQVNAQQRPAAPAPAAAKPQTAGPVTAPQGGNISTSDQLNQYLAKLQADTDTSFRAKLANGGAAVVSVRGADGGSQNYVVAASKGANGTTQYQLVSPDNFNDLMYVPLDGNLRDLMKGAQGLALNPGTDAELNHRIHDVFNLKTKIINGTEMIFAPDLVAKPILGNYTEKMTYKNQAGEKVDLGNQQPHELWTYRAKNNDRIMFDPATDEGKKTMREATGVVKDFTLTNKYKPSDAVDVADLYKENGYQYDGQAGKPVVARFKAQVDAMNAATGIANKTPPSAVIDQAALRNNPAVVIFAPPQNTAQPVAAAAPAPKLANALPVKDIAGLAALNYGSQMGPPADQGAQNQILYRDARASVRELQNEMREYFAAQENSPERAAAERKIIRTVGGASDEKGAVTGGIPENYRQAAVNYINDALKAKGAILPASYIGQIDAAYQGRNASAPAQQSQPQQQPQLQRQQQPPAAGNQNRAAPIAAQVQAQGAGNDLTALKTSHPELFLPANLSGDKMAAEKQLYDTAKAVEGAIRTLTNPGDPRAAKISITRAQADALTEQFAMAPDNLQPGLNRHAASEYYLRLKNEGLGSVSPASGVKTLEEYRADRAKITQAPQPSSINYEARMKLPEKLPADPVMRNAVLYGAAAAVHSGLALQKISPQDAEKYIKSLETAGGLGAKIASSLRELQKDPSRETAQRTMTDMTKAYSEETMRLNRQMQQQGKPRAAVYGSAPDLDKEARLETPYSPMSGSAGTFATAVRGGDGAAMPIYPLFAPGVDMKAATDMNTDLNKNQAVTSGAPKLA